MGLFGNFVERAMAAKLDRVAAKMEQAGAQGVSLARDLVPVRTGQLQASIAFYFSRAEMSLTLVADAPHAAFVEHGTRYMRARPYLAPAVREIREQFGLKDVSGQTSNVAGKYEGGYQSRAGKGVIIGRRPRRRGR